MARPIWNGTISFGLLNVPVQLFSGDRGTDVHLRMLDSRDNKPVRYERVNSDTGEEMLYHEGEEAGVLVAGRLELTVGDEVYVLECGDSYYFQSNQPHRFRNPYEVPARLISATTPANF